jgi:hypothetical protein
MYYGSIRTNYLTPWSIVCTEKMVANQLVKKFPPFMQLESLLLYSQEPITGPYSDSAESSPHPHAILL